MNRSKSIIKIVLTFILMTIVVFGAMSSVDAIKIKVKPGKSQTINTGDLIKDNNLYCIEHGAALDGKKHSYVVAAKIDITGKTAKIQTKSKTYSKTNNYNAQVAYILAKKGGYGDNWGKYTRQQVALYRVKNKWLKSIGLSKYATDTKSITKKEVGKTKWNNATKLINQAKAYAKSVPTTAEKDMLKNNKKLKDIKSESAQIGDTSYIRVGPFNWTFTQNLNTFNVYNQDNKKVSDVKFYQNKNICNLSNLKSGKDFYILLKPSDNITKISKIDVKTKSVKVKTVGIYVLTPKKGNQQNLLKVYKVGNKNLQGEDTVGAIDISKDITIYKVDNTSGTKKYLEGVGFKLYNKELKKYVKRDSKGNISYVSKSEATEFITDKNGKIEIKNLMIGTYIAYETANPNKSYPLDKQEAKEGIEIATNESSKEIGNQPYINISGLIWVDQLDNSKKAQRDHLYTKGERFDDSIVVILKDKNGKEIARTTKLSDVYGNGGTGYRFEEIAKEQLDGAYVEFTYNGIKYQADVVNSKVDNGSKSKETKSRDELNAKFENIANAGEANRQKVKTSGGIEATYADIKDGESTLDLNSVKGCDVVADTSKVLNLKEEADKLSTDSNEIKYVNLGLYVKEQSDFNLVKDLNNVQISINGYNHIYTGKKKITEEQDEYDSNMGVSFKGKYTGRYGVPVYKSDLEFKGEEDKQIKAYLIYSILVGNNSSYNGKVNSIVDYYDSKYTIDSIGTGIGENNELTNKLSADKYTAKDGKLEINNTIDLGANKAKTIYVKFAITNENNQLWKIVSEETDVNKIEDKLSYNYAEITSYSTYDSKGKPVAVFDQNSVPGNAIAGKVETYDNDTDVAPPVAFILRDARKITGNVFEDISKNGILDEQEIKDGRFLEGVTVILCDENGNEIKDENGNNKYEVKTKKDGSYEITGFVPGKYTIKYVWGDKDHPVETWKGTIYNKDRNQNNTRWYEEDVDTRYTDAIDNYETRSKIDLETQEKYNNNFSEDTKNEIYGDNPKGVITQMDSITPVIEFGIEQEDKKDFDYSEYIIDGSKIQYIIKNIDFGITERAKQSIELSKVVKHIKVGFPNGQTLIDADVERELDSQGRPTGKYKFTGNTTNVSGVAPEYILAQIDSELLQGSTLEITYAINVTNTSEEDYAYKDYYLYGIKPSESEKDKYIIKIIPSGIVDFLDSKLTSTDTNWTQDGQMKINESQRVIYNYTKNDSLEAIAPGETTSSITFIASKQIQSTDNLTFDNDVGVKEITKYVANTGESMGAPIIVDKTYTIGDSTIAFMRTAKAEQVRITAPTGGNKALIIPVSIGIVALVILGAGVVLIKKKV